MKKISKIGISLLIALCFIIPTGAVMANPSAEREEAEDYGLRGEFSHEVIGSRDDQTTPITEQDTTTIIHEFMLETPVGEFATDDGFVHNNEIVPTEEWFKPWFKLETLDPTSVYEPELEIYKMNDEESYCIYETSFEDNARNYLEWGQIDLDCGISGGYYDGWSWSDARACDGEHSFKSTMYDEYKNMQQDLLYMKNLINLDTDEFELCDGTILRNVDVDKVNVSFDIFVDGEFADWYNSGSPDYFEFYSPLDYVQFGYIDGVDLEAIEMSQVFIDSSGYAIDQDYPISSSSPPFGTGDFVPDDFIFFDTSIPLFDVDSPGGPYKDYSNKAQKIDGCPGWWHVWAEIDVSTIDDFGLWFEWISDKERVYEGAYVDNVEIDIITGLGEKIYQGHSQDWIVDEIGGIDYFEFPLVWDDFEISVDFVDGVDKNPVYYQAICKIKTDDGGYVLPHKIINFEIGDLVDCEINYISVEDDFTHEEVPNGGTLTYPSDAHIMFNYHNNGNDVIENIPITATAYKLEKEQLFFDDFEGFSGWEYYYDGAYLSDDQSWSGSKSLAFNNPNTLHYDNGGIYYAVNGEMIDTEDLTEAHLDMYLKYKLGDGEQFRLAMNTYYWTVAHKILLDTSGVYTPVYPGAVMKDWLGPMQPQCHYVSVDWLSEVERMRGFGYFTDENGHMTYDAGISLYLLCDDSDVFYGTGSDEETDWSGVYVDDISITATVLGDKVWEDTMVLPGPCEPCESCMDQFTWEDVPYSCYRVVIDAGCEGDVSAEFPEESNNWAYTDFCVLEPLEQASKADGVDYTECTPDSWCISDVVGNDCGGEDHYALATNCDTNMVPAGVNDYIALTPGDSDCGMIDVSHLEFQSRPPAPGPWTTIADMPVDYPDGLEWGLAEFDLSAYAGKQIQIGFHRVTPDGGSAAWGVDLVTLNGGLTFLEDFESGVLTWEDDPDPSEWEVSTWLAPTTPPGEGLYDLECWWTFGVQDELVMTPIIDLTGETLVTLEFLCSHMGENEVGFDWEEHDYIKVREWTGGVAPCVPTCTVEGFETAFPPAGWFNTPGVGSVGWIDELYIGGAWGSPNTGSNDAYCNDAGSVLTMPVTITAAPTTLDFYYAKESSYGPDQNMEVYISDGLNPPVLIDSFLGINQDSFSGYAHAGPYDLNTYGTGPFFIEFHVLPDATGSNNGGDYDYGLNLDDIGICVLDCEPPEYDELILDMTYQCDLAAGAEVILEIAGVSTQSGGAGPVILQGFDSFGDGWDSSTIDVYVNGDPVITGFTLTGSFNEVSFFAQNGDVVTIDYTDGTSWDSEVSWQLLVNGGVIASDVAPSGDTTTDVTISGFESCDNCPTVGCACPDGITSWQEVATFTGNAPGVCQTETVDLAEYLYEGETDICLRFRLDTTAYDPELYDYAGPGIGFHLHDLSIADLFYDGITGETSDFFEGWEDANYVNEESDMKWVIDCVTFGEHWETTDDFKFCTMTDYNGDEILELGYPAEPIDEALIWSTEIADAYEAYLYANWEYNIGNDALLTFELSADGGDNWYIISKIEGPASSGREAVPCADPFDLTPWAGSNILVRVRIQNDGGEPGYVCVDSLRIYGKQDFLPPSATISLSGNLIGPGLYAGPVTVTINAVDDMAMGEIHYILDGTESVVSGNKATFKVSDDGEHTIDYWAVDAVGNEGSRSTTSFNIDNTPPTVALTAPEPGLYLFGNQLLSMSKPFIIGAFTAEATASDGQGVAVVQFMLNGEIVGEDTEAPYNAYIAVKNMGAATLKAVAEDGVGNTAEDSMDITYYKFL